MFKIIHISDLHIQSEKIDLENRAFIDALAEDIANYVDENTILCFTGDIIDKGGIYFEHKENAFNYVQQTFFDVILKRNTSLKDRIFIVPGNHDLQRDKVDKISQAGMEKLFYENISHANEFIENNTVPNGYLKQFELLYAFLKENYKSNNVFNNSHIIELSNGQTIGVACLNSNLMSLDNDDYGKLILTKYQIINSLSTISNCSFRVCLMHHPVSFFLETDRMEFEPFLREFNVLLTGHTHKLNSGLEQNLYGNFFKSESYSSLDLRAKTDEEHRRGYSVVEYFPNHEVKISHRKYLSNHQKFVPDTNIGTDDGIKTYTFPTEKNSIAINAAYKALETISNVRIDSFNKDLLITKNDKNNNEITVEQIFVDRTISNFINSEVASEEDEIVTLSIEDLYISESNHLIYGAKESGKTILLDKIIIDLSNRFDSLQIIPIHFKFDNLKNTEVIDIVKIFLNLSINEAKSIIENYKILLVIDNICFDEKYKHELNKLSKFISENGNVRLIATSLLFSESIIPTEYFAYNDKFNFKVLFLQNLNAKQIKNLISKWFDTNNIDYRESIEKIIKNIKDLSLSSTPLAVTMFLWIIEKQEKRPTNSSTLIELFVENLLEKAHFENVISDSFDFHNKQRFLAHIAYYMLNNGDSEMSYSLDYVELLDFAKKYLKNRIEFSDIAIEKVLNDFFNRGMLIKNENTLLVKFKSAFLFSYFLARYMDFDSTFKEYILSEDNYLNFTNEIEYYSGLKRDSLEMLNFTQKKLLESFNDLNDTILNDNDFEIDDFFETKELMSQNISLENASRKMSEDEIDGVYEEQLQSVNSTTDIPQKIEKIKNHYQLDKVLKLAAAVLKNSEEVDDFESKVKAYSNIVVSSISFLILYKTFIVDNYESTRQKYQKQLPKHVTFDLFLKLLPLIHQVMLYNWISSVKTKPILKHKLLKDNETYNISEFEKFITVFSIADIRSNEYDDIIKDFIKNSKRSYILDLAFFKLLVYYHLRSKTHESDKFFLNLLGEIKVKTGQISKNGKSSFIQGLEKSKQLRLFKE